MQFDGTDIIIFLGILALLLLVIILYNLLFVIINLRKTSQRVEDVSKEVEGIILKPLSLVEESMSWITEFLLSMYGEVSESKKPAKKSSSKKK